MFRSIPLAFRTSCVIRLILLRAILYAPFSLLRSYKSIMPSSSMVISIPTNAVARNGFLFITADTVFSHFFATITIGFDAVSFSFGMGLYNRPDGFFFSFSILVSGFSSTGAAAGTTAIPSLSFSSISLSLASKASCDMSSSGLHIFIKAVS